MHVNHMHSSLLKEDTLLITLLMQAYALGVH